ncbi:MAG: FGGY family carbohydrate kinase [Acidobacteriota bacterium]|nr:FGGY family carbohydrate kinase [Acidobacteriota bacterium]MDH3783923.1 FGGY family carbohydrate kinase [Acidobacteriota bacterium]
MDLTPVAIALDLGSTRFKGGVLFEDGQLGPIKSVPAPPLVGIGVIREGDPQAYVEAAEDLLGALLDGLPRGLPLGIASQRSSFLLIDEDGGVPQTSLISWQDQRAASWCDAHRELEPTVFARTGLVLSGHYIGPKIAAMLEGGGDIAAIISRPSTRLVTLEGFLAWKLSGGKRHAMDATMAARTSLFDIESRQWSPTLLEAFGVPQHLLPEVVQTDGQDTALRGGLHLKATIADQAAGANASLPGDDGLLISLGTGAFLLRGCSDPTERRSGFLTAPILAADEGRWRHVLEGAISGAGTAIDRFGAGPTELPLHDSDAEAFCIPDTAGLGSPHWRADIGFTFSAAARSLPTADQRRIALEGLLFRVYETAQGLCPAGPPDRILVTGGLARETFVIRGLAALLGRPIEVLQLPEAVLLAAGRLAAGMSPDSDVRTDVAEPAAAGRYLGSKYGAWRTWLRRQLQG